MCPPGMYPPRLSFRESPSLLCFLFKRDFFFLRIFARKFEVGGSETRASLVHTGWGCGGRVLVCQRNQKAVAPLRNTIDTHANAWYVRGSLELCPVSGDGGEDDIRLVNQSKRGKCRVQSCCPAAADDGRAKQRKEPEMVEHDNNAVTTLTDDNRTPYNLARAIESLIVEATDLGDVRVNAQCVALLLMHVLPDVDKRMSEDDRVFWMRVGIALGPDWIQMLRKTAAYMDKVESF